MVPMERISRRKLLGGGALAAAALPVLHEVVPHRRLHARDAQAAADHDAAHPGGTAGRGRTDTGAPPGGAGAPPAATPRLPATRPAGAARTAGSSPGGRWTTPPTGSTPRRCCATSTTAGS